MKVEELSPCAGQFNENVDDFLPWSASLAIDAYGLRIDIRTNDASLLEPLAAHLPFGWTPTKTNRVDRLYSFCATKNHNTDTHSTYVLRQGMQLLTVTGNLEEALQVFEYDVELHVAECAPRYVFVHAGAVGWQGGAIVIPGRSFSGKSSLVAALCHFGATYYSDEFAVLDLQGHVHPYRRKLHLREAIPHIPSLNPANPADSAALPPLPISLVVLTHFQAQAQWNPRLLSRGQTMLDLMVNTMCTQRQPQTVLAVLKQTLRSAFVIQSPRGEASEIANHLLRLASASRASVSIRGLGTSEPSHQDRLPKLIHDLQPETR